MRREFETVTCPGCNRPIRAFVPHMGDGTGLRTPKHNLVDPRRTRTRPIECFASRSILVRANGKWEIEQ